MKLFKSIKEGQIWEYSYDEKNPFKETTITQRKVLKVNGDYVKWEEDGVIRSDEKYWFLINTKLVE